MEKIPWETTAATRRRMQATKSSDTRLERRMRSELTRLGVRYRLQRRPEPDLRVRSDIVFVGARVIVDLRGCYWHACELHTIWPKSNVSRWEEKLLGNRARDQRVVEELTKRGWLVMIVWEHDDLVSAADRIKSIVDGRRHGRTTDAMVWVDPSVGPSTDEA